MSRRRKSAGAEPRAGDRVCGFRLQDSCDQKLQDLAKCAGVTPNTYAKVVLTAHLLGHVTTSANQPSAPTATVPVTTSADVQPVLARVDELGQFLHQVRDELVRESEGQEKRLDTLAARVNALVAHENTLTSHLNALTKQVQQVDERLAEFLSRVEPV